jgi:hypothetical protein
MRRAEQRYEAQVEQLQRQLREAERRLREAEETSPRPALAWPLQELHHQGSVYLLDERSGRMYTCPPLGQQPRPAGEAPAGCTAALGLHCCTGAALLHWGGTAAHWGGTAAPGRHVPHHGSGAVGPLRRLWGRLNRVAPGCAASTAWRMLRRPVHTYAGALAWLTSWWRCLPAGHKQGASVHLGPRPALDLLLASVDAHLRAHQVQLPDLFRGVERAGPGSRPRQLLADMMLQLVPELNPRWAAHCGSPACLPACPTEERRSCVCTSGYKPHAAAKLSCTAIGCSLRDPARPDSMLAKALPKLHHISSTALSRP